jgi:hypothetical protein
MTAQMRGVGIWTGELAFDLFSPRGIWAGTARIVVRLDTVEVFTDRQLAVFHRTRLHDWLRTHRQPLAVEDVVWLVRRSAFTVRLADSDPYPVPDDITNTLLRVL